MSKKNYPSKKAFSILIVFMMLLAVLSTVTAGTIFKRNNENESSLMDKTKINTVKSLIQDKFGRIYEKFRLFSEKIKQKISDLDRTNNNILSKSTDSLESNSLSFPLKFYTNYDGVEKTSTLRLFKETKIDIDNDIDSTNDIGVYLKIYPGIVQPFALSINYKISIRQLSGFDDLDKDAYFKAMSQFSFPGLLSRNLTGDQLEFGYESPENELIPEKCDVTYKLVPHLFSIRKKPDHRFKIEPDAVTDGSAKLNLIFGYTEADDGSEIFSKVSYDPVVDSEITFKRSKGSGVSLFEYERTISSETNVDLYLAYINGDNTTCAYALDLPDYVGFSLKLGPEGKAEFSTDTSVTEIGLCDDIENPKNKVYFSDMFTLARLEWTRDPFLFLTSGNFNASVYTEGEGASFNVHLEGDSGGTADFSISPDATIIDASLELDLSDGYFRVNRNEFGLLVSFSVSVLNESISSFLSTLDGSFNLVRLSGGPFEIFFDDLFDGDVEIYLSGKSFELSDVDITGFSETIGGNFSVSMDSLIKETSGFIRFSLSVEKEGNNVSGSCRFEIDRGVEIVNLSLKFNNFVFSRESISTSLSMVKYYPFSICVSIVEWYVASDLSSGHIVVEGNSSVMFSFDSTYSDGSEVVGRVSGTIQLKTTSDFFNVSWETIDGNLSVNLDGSALVALSDFYLWIKEKVEISIPEISVNFQLNTVGQDGNLVLYLEDNVVSGNINIEDINITDLFNITLKCSIYAVLDASASGTINLNWNESGITSIDGGFEADATGSIDITNLEFKFKTLVDISITRLFIAGGLNVDFSSIDGNMSVSADVDLTDIVISDLSIYSSMSDPLGVSADMDITFDGSGFINLTYSNGTVVVDGAVYGDSDITINSFWFLVPGIGIEINLESFLISGSMTVLFDVDMSKDIPVMVTLFTDSEVTADIIYLGYPGTLQIFIYDFVGGGTGGTLGVGLNSATGKPVIDLNHSTCFIGNLQFLPGSGGPPISLENLSLEGTARIESFLDLVLFRYVCLKGEIMEDTTITFKNMDIPLFGTCNVSIVLEPGYLDLLFQQDLGGQFYVYGYSSSWVSVRIDDRELVKLVGALDLWVNLYQSDDGTFSVIIDAKEMSGAIILLDTLRVAGEVNALIDFSIKVVEDEGVTTISDLYINVTGALSAVVQIKANETDWIPIIPFSTSGQVVLLKQASSLMEPPDLINDFVVTTPEDNASLTFEVWYAPPLGEDSTSIGPYTYNVSFGDGTYYEVITDDNRIVTDPHQYMLGEYDASVTITTSDSSIGSIDDDLSFEIIKKITYLKISDAGQLDLRYDDVESDGRIHTWFTIRNKAEENYELEWEAAVIPYGFDGTGMDPIADPETGVLGPGETVRVNASFYPPIDHKDHDSIYLSADNINYTGYGQDGTSILASIKQSLSLYPSGIYLPNLSPGGEISSSIWIHNNKQEALSWSITDYPNDNYSFSSTSGEISVGGAEIVHFTITAPDENGIDLGGDIEITDLDGPTNVAISYVNVKTKGPGGSSDSNVTVTEDINGNVSIAIGGSNEIHINNFQFEINGIIGELNGHFIFDTNDSYVFINWTKGDLSNFSVEGTAEFSINNFCFTYGDNISIEVSKMITGGIQWRKGRSGNLTIHVDDTFTDVDINVSLNVDEYTNFTIAGNFDIDIDGEMDGTIWFDWEYGDESSKNLTIGGDLLGYHDVNIDITDFEIMVNGFYLYAETIFFNATIDILVNETGLHIESESSFELGNIYFEFEFEGGDWEIFSINNAEFILDGSISFSFSVDEDLFCVTLDGYFEIHATVIGNLGDISFQVTVNLIMSGFWRVCGGPA